MINLGDEVKDRVSGLKGIAVARYTPLAGCDSIHIQPPIGGDGKLPKAVYIEESLLDVLVSGQVDLIAEQ